MFSLIRIEDGGVTKEQFELLAMKSLHSKQWSFSYFEFNSSNWMTKYLSK